MTRGLRALLVLAAAVAAAGYLERLEEYAHPTNPRRSWGQHAPLNPRPQPEHLNPFHTSSNKQGFMGKLLHPHEPTLWERIVASFETHEPTTWERLFGEASRDTWWAWITGKAADAVAGRSLHHRASWRTRLGVTMRVGWLVLTQMLTNGLDVALFCYDVLAFMVLWEQIRSALFGPSATSSVLLRVGKVAEKAFNVIAGQPGVPQRERTIRLALSFTVLLPLVVTAFLFLVLPSMLFAVAAKNAIPLAVGFMSVGVVHALQHRPLSWFVNATAVTIVLNCFRIVAAIFMYALAQATVVSTVAGVRGIKARLGASGAMPAQAQAQAGMAQPFVAPAPSNVPPVGTSTNMAAITTGQRTGGADVLRFFDTNLARLGQILTRADEIVERSARKASDAASAPAMDPNLDMRQRSASGGQIIDSGPQPVMTQSQEVTQQPESFPVSAQPSPMHSPMQRKAASAGARSRRRRRA